MEVCGISLVTPINQTPQPETHFGLKKLFAPYDWASRRVCVTPQRRANEIPNQQRAPLELSAIAALLPLPPVFPPPFIRLY